jgi:hypothetical protein
LRIREYHPGDLDALRRMHAAQGFGYPLPDLANPLFVSKLILQDNNDDTEPASPSAGRELAHGDSPHDGSPIVMAALLRVTAETYLLHDPCAGTPSRRWQRLLALHQAARRDAAERGLEDVQAFLPPRVARAFGRRLQRMGWTRDPWPCFTLRLE